MGTSVTCGRRQRVQEGRSGIGKEYRKGGVEEGRTVGVKLWRMECVQH